MKRLYTFDEFVNENVNLIMEGAMAKKACSSKNAEPIEGQHGEEWEKVDLEIAKALGVGKDLSKVYQLDSEWEDAGYSKAEGKIYDYLVSKFSPTKNLPDHGEVQSLEYDAKLNVVKFEDYGMIGFCFTANSNF